LRLAPCRDCGLEIDLDSRGCPRCARNLDAERAVAKLVRLAFVFTVALVILAAAYFTFRRR
jgi:predicted nucleic acid-binding Zn ribbon protein